MLEKAEKAEEQSPACSVTDSCADCASAAASSPTAFDAPALSGAAAVGETFRVASARAEGARTPRAVGAREGARGRARRRDAGQGCSGVEGKG